ncbi:MAG: sulfotransferase, partial [Myxococcota bacterium]
ESDTPTEFQQSLLAGLRDGRAFETEVPALSDASRQVLEQASSAWPGQTWITRLLGERNQEVARLQAALEKAENRANPTRTRPSGVPRALDEDRVPGVFILGSPRSGTSIFSWAVAAHPGFETSAESDFLLTLFGGARLHGSYKSAYDRPDVGWLKKMEVGYREFAAFAGLGIEYLYLDRYAGRRWVDATPSYTSMAEELRLLFPAARFLHILRDGRAVVNSMCSSGFPVSWANDFAKACQTWSHYATRGRALAEAHPDRVLEVRYESLIADPAGEMERTFRFLGEDPCEDSVTLISTQRINSSYGNVDGDDIRKPKDPGTAPLRPWEDWNEGQRETFRETAGPVMEAMGYALDFGES